MAELSPDTQLVLDAAEPCIAPQELQLHIPRTLITMSEVPPANQFRVGETWVSPSSQRWYVQRIDNRGRAVLRNVDDPSSMQYRCTVAIGNNIEDAWLRIDPPSS